MVVAFIVACEVLFWVFVLGGLSARYLLRLRRTSTALLLAVPLLDVVLLAAIALHLRAGGTADASHALGALYLGFTVAFGHQVITWADKKFAQRFAGAPAPPKRPRIGAPAVRYEVAGWLRTTLGCAIGAGVLLALIAATGDPARTEALRGTFALIAIIMFWNTVIAVWGIVEARLGSRKDADARTATPTSAAGEPAAPPADIAPATGGAARTAAVAAPAHAPHEPAEAGGRPASPPGSTQLWIGGILLAIAAVTVFTEAAGPLFGGSVEVAGWPGPLQLGQAALGAGLVVWGLIARSSRR